MDHSTPAAAGSATGRGDTMARGGRRRYLGVMIRLALRSALLVTAVLPVVAAPLRAQVDDSPPDTVAAEFLRGLQSMAWDGLAQRLHPEALAYLRIAVDIPIQADTTGWALANMGGAPSLAEYEARSDARVFADVMRWTQANVMGLLSSLVSREADLIGVVVEDSETAHAVYRVRTVAYGAEPTVQVATLARTESGWKVRDAPELRTLHTALRGMPVPRRTP